MLSNAASPDVATGADGNERLCLLPNGNAAFEALKTLIDEAAIDLRLLFYIFAADATGAAIRERLLAARARGVAVTLVVDDFGSLDTPHRFFQPLIDAGCRFQLFQPRLFQRYLLRNHQKLAIADSARAIVGSFNIADVNLSADPAIGWSDIGVLVEGAAARRLSRYFDALDLWTRTRRPRIRRLRRVIEAANETRGSVRWVFGGPSMSQNHYARQVRDALAGACAVDLIMAYFAPGPGVLAALRALARKGRLRLVAAGKTDVPLSRAAAWHTYRQLLKSGAEIYEYQPRPLHSKLIVADDVVFIGSGNFDVRSLFVNLEVMLRVERPDFVAEARRLFEAERTQSLRVDLPQLQARRRWYKRLFWRLAYFLMVSVDSFLSLKFAR